MMRHHKPSYYRGAMHATLAWLFVYMLVSFLGSSSTSHCGGNERGGLSMSTTSSSSSLPMTTLRKASIPDTNSNVPLIPVAEDTITRMTTTTMVLATETASNGTTLQVIQQEQVEQGDDDMRTVNRALLRNGNVVTSQALKVQFYESLVHPAFMASSTPVHKVLLMGGTTGGTLAQVLKYSNITQVTVVLSPVDQIVQRLSSKYLSSLDDKNIWNDKRVKVIRHHDNTWAWLQDYVGDHNEQACLHMQQHPDKLFDLILVDKLDLSEMQAAHRSNGGDSDSGDESDDSSDFDSSDSEDSSSSDEDEDDQDKAQVHVFHWAKKISCAVQTFGVVSMSMGEAPPPGFSTALKQTNTANNNKPLHKQRTVQVYLQRLEIMRQMMDYFWHRRVYEIPLWGRYWSVAMGMVPYTKPIEQDEVLQRAVFDGRTTGGANDFDDRPAKINLQLRRKLQPSIRLEYYDGVVQQFFQHPAGDWHGIYCLDPAHDRVCHLAEAFSTDYEDDFMHLQLEPDHNGKSGTRAKVKIPKGTITGLWDAATDINLPAIQFYRSRHLAEGFDTQYHDFAAWVDTYGFDGGPSGLGERVQISINSYHNFLNHDCSHQPNMVNFEKWAPWTKQAMRGWNPIRVRLAGELDHFKVAARNIEPGELILDDYSKWDGFLQSRNGKQDFSRLDEWCNSSTGGRKL